MEERCKFCRDRNISDPCIKLWGPKRTAALELSISGNTTAIELSRPLTQYDRSIDSKGVMLLQYCYSEEFWRVSKPMPCQLIRLFSSVYGAAVVHLSLRHAILNYVSLFRGLEAESLEHNICANFQLQRKLSRPDTLDEGDLFVPLLLAISEILEKKEDDITTHMSGFMAIMEVLFNRVGGNIKSYELSVFWPLVRDMLGSFVGVADFADRCRHLLGVSCLAQVKEYTEALSCVSRIETDPSLYAGLQVVAMMQEWTTLRRLVRSKVSVEPGNPGACGSSTSVQAVSSIQRLNRSEERLQIPEALSLFLSAISSQPVRSWSGSEKKALLSLSLRSMLMAYVTVSSQLVLLFRAILNASTT